MLPALWDAPLRYADGRWREYLRPSNHSRQVWFISLAVNDGSSRARDRRQP